MSQQLFEVSGISLDGAISILYGTSVPGTAQDTIDAPQGSVYFDTAGTTWKKMAAGAGADKWLQNGGSGTVSGINALRGVVGNTVVDSLDATVMDTGVWAVTVSSAATPANHQTVIITGSHNGTIAKYSLYSRLDFGVKIQGITYDVRLNSGKFELMVFAPVQANIDCYRLNAVSNGATVTLVTSGGGGGSGGVDLTPQLNAEIAARTAADTALTAAIANKADIAGLATQFTNINNQIAAETSARIAADTALQAAIAAGGGGVSTVNYNFAVEALGVPASNALIGLYVTPATFDLSGAGVAKALTAATAQAVFTVKNNGTSIGTITFAAGSSTGVVAVTPTSLVTGDELAIWSPIVADATLADVAITLLGAGASTGAAAPQVNSDWNATTGVAAILNKPTLVTAADITAAVAVETSARQAADTALQASIDTAVANAVSPAQLAAAIAAIPADNDSSFVTVTTLTSSIAAEAAARQAAIDAIPTVPPLANSVTGKPIRTQYSTSASFDPTAGAIEEATSDITYLDASLSVALGLTRLFQMASDTILSGILVYASAIDATAPMVLKVTLYTSAARTVDVVDGNGVHHTKNMGSVTSEIFLTNGVVTASPLSLASTDFTLRGDTYITTNMVVANALDITSHTASPTVPATALFPVDNQKYIFAGDSIKVEIISGGAAWRNIRVQLVLQSGLLG